MFFQGRLTPAVEGQDRPVKFTKLAEVYKIKLKTRAKGVTLNQILTLVAESILNEIACSSGIQAIAILLKEGTGHIREKIRTLAYTIKLVSCSVLSV